ncbi:hypothetical protein [Gillisia marina]|uniref:hypothetical protein n=1 Tax=Gillisia marina TaxID=1167637 RepID=UPI00029AA451|nr:hypothetical protein [Gillisia marina]
MKQLFTILLLFAFSHNLSSQSKPESIRSLLDEYYKFAMESIYLHINKTEFIKNEEIWFKGYIIDQQNFKPFLETSNIYVTLFDSKGKLKESKLFLAKSGYLEGSIKLDSTFTAGNYYIQAETSWMRNFKESEPFLEKIEILDETVITNEPSLITYDVQFLPEGGNMLIGVNNVVGVKSVNNYGYGIEIKNGEIFDQDDNFIKSFETKIHGLGTFLFNPENNKNYYAVIEFKDGNRQTFDLPDSSSKGISLILQNNFDQKNIGFKLSTNLKSLNSNGLLKAYYLIHKNGNSSMHSVEFDKSNLSKSFLLKKADIATGVNTITLFNQDLTPISERKFFNNYNFKLPDVQLENIKKDKDSISLKLNIEGIEDNFNVSISILPEATASMLNNSIVSQFYLQPHLRGFIQDPAYYFRNFSKEKLFHLELLLLNQGWSKYEWNEIFKESKKINFPFEKGLSLVGTINRDINDENEILFHNSLHHLMKSIKLSPGEKEFIMSGMYIEKEEKLKFSLIDKKFQLSRPPIYLRVDPLYKVENLDLQWPDNPDFTSRDFSNQEFSKFLNDFNRIELNTVELIGKKKKIIPRTQTLPGYLESKVTIVDEDLIRIFPDMISLIRSKGYDVREGLQGYGGGASSASISNITIRSYRGGGLRLILDGQRMPNFDELTSLPTSRIESFYFDRLGSYEGAMGGFNEVLYLFTRLGPTLEDLNREELKNLVTFTPNIAFEKPKQYYSPKYADYTSEPFKKFGSVHWVPSVTSFNHTMNVKLPDFGLNNIKLFIEGMNAEGVLISKVINVNLK